jgi:hypothetical protein
MFMYNKMRVATFLALLFVSQVSMGDTAWLDRSRASFDKRLRNIVSEPADDSGDWVGGYRAELKKLENAAQAAGDLEGLLLIREEIHRFQTSRAIPESPAENAPKVVIAAQQKFSRLASSRSLGKSRKVLTLRKNYTAYMEKKKKEQTVLGDVASAMAAKAEIERIEANPTIKAALADVAAAAGKDNSDATVASSKPAGEKVKKPRPPAGYEVYPLGRRPPRVSGEIFTRLMLSNTGNTPAADTDVAVAAARNSKSSVSKSSSLYSSRTSKTTTKTSKIRLQVRASRSGVTLKGEILKLQVYNKRAGTGNNEPELAASGTIHLDDLTSAGIYIDCPEVSARSAISSSRRYSYSRYSTGGSSTAKSGSEFYGIVVNVYNSDGSLSYQGASTSGLKAQAAKSVRRSKKEALTEELDVANAKYTAARTAYYNNTSDDTLRQNYMSAQQTCSTLRQAISEAGD